MEKLTNTQITIVEALYLCVIKKGLKPDTEYILIDRLYREHQNMYIYFDWLMYRWKYLKQSEYELPARYNE